MRSLNLGLYELSTNEKFVVGGVGGLGVIIESNLNRVRLSCFGFGCDNWHIPTGQTIRIN